MNISFRLRHLAVPAMMASTLLSGCATPTKPLYQWEDYQPQVYAYFKGESKQAQIDVLVRDLQKITAAGNVPPPGYHAHLGLLYADTGRDDQMVMEFRAEKRLFPESSAYMDFLMKNAQRQEGMK